MADVATQPARKPWRPVLGLRRRPGRLALVLFRMPLRAYDHGKGWMLGHVFLLLTHRGRKTGVIHETVVMVLRYRPETHEAVACSAWGPETDWIRNIRVQPAHQVEIGSDTFIPEQRFLSDDESYSVLGECLRRHPWRFRFMSFVMGWGNLRDESVAREFVRARPFVAFRPADMQTA